MGMKSRGNWSTGVCFKPCANRDIKCDECFRFSQFKQLADEKADEERKENDKESL